MRIKIYVGIVLIIFFVFLVVIFAAGFNETQNYMLNTQTQNQLLVDRSQVCVLAASECPPTATSNSSSSRGPSATGQQDQANTSASASSGAGTGSTTGTTVTRPTMPVPPPPAPTRRVVVTRAS